MSRHPTNTRRSIATLPADDRAALVRALIATKADGTWDRYVRLHQEQDVRRIARPPWRRSLLLRFEGELRAHEPGVVLPYWDWMRDRSPVAPPFTPDLLGGDGDPGGVVRSGPFAHEAGRWAVTVTDSAPGNPELRRRFGVSGRLPDALDLATARRAATWAELAHAIDVLDAAVHRWVGGNMLQRSAPNDPVYWFHACNLDRLWMAWQADHPAVAWPGSDVLDADALGYRYDRDGD